MTSSRFDFAADQRRDAVARARPVRVVPLDQLPADETLGLSPDNPWAAPRDVPPGIHLILCRCGAKLTTYDTGSGLFYADRWSMDRAGRWRPVRGHHQEGSKSLTGPERVGPWDVGIVVLSTGTRERGDLWTYGVLPATEANGWRKLALPALMICRSCGAVNVFDLGSSRS
jgi:hypothetical protein